jgi:hypothetical protein
VITKQEAVRLLRKLGFSERTGRKHMRFIYFYGEVRAVSTTVSYGRGELHIEDQIRRQITLNREQFVDALACPFKEEHYIAHLIRIGRITPDPN